MKAARDVAALIRFIDSRQDMPHACGSKANDCMSYTAGAVEAQTGFNPARGLSWAGDKGAARLLVRLGGAEAALDARFERVAPAHAMRGDIAGVPDDELGIHPMIVEGMTLVGPGERGNRRLRRAAMICAWSAVQPKGTDSE